MTKVLFACVAVLVLIQPTLAFSQAEVVDTVVAPAEDDLTHVIVPAVLEAAEFRPWILTIHYSPLDLVLPNKIGGSVARRDSENSQWELEYSHGSLSPFFISQIGGFTEDRISVLRRFGTAKSAGFQWFYGAFYQNFKLHVGNALMSRLSSGSVPSADLISISGLGATVGLGYRWLLKEKFVIGLDAAWSQPLITTQKESKFLDVVTDADDREKVETGVRIMQYFPRFVVAKIALGYNF